MLPYFLEALPGFIFAVAISSVLVTITGWVSNWQDKRAQRDRERLRAVRDEQYRRQLAVIRGIVEPESAAPIVPEIGQLERALAEPRYRGASLSFPPGHKPTDAELDQHYRDYFSR
jgi:hypothetical protein